VAHAGGLATPPGPCGRWHVSQPCASPPCLVFASGAWQLVQAAFALDPLCD